jgi:hypothetical protein
MIKGRVVVAALAASLFASSALSGAAAAANRSAGVSNVLGFAGAFAAPASFSARWQVRSWSGEGSVVWLVENFEFTSVITRGRECNVSTCDEWFHSASVKFYNSAGTQVASFALAAPNGNTVCGVWGPSVIGQADKKFSKCKFSFEAPRSATKIKISWTVGVVNGAGVSYPNAWSASTAKVSLD